MGQKSVADAARHPQLACKSTAYHPYSTMDYSYTCCVVQSRKFELFCCAFAFRIPTAYTYALAALTSVMHTDPPIHPNCTKRRPSQGHQPRSPRMCLSRTISERFLWGGSLEVCTPPIHQPHQPSLIGPIFHLIALKFRIPYI
eukprot:1158263-Pelagomonas_calceolata.AAC.6